MSDARVKLGRQGEELAVAELARSGYEIVARNWRCQAGEVDVVACRDGVFHFFEVRTRRGREYGAPEESVTPAKRRRMVDVALAYLGEHGLDDADWRIGFVAVEMDRTGQLLRLEVYDSIE
ncbi:MAG: YraN family protein [Anaerolineae bacterium]|nr:YraN family protein [Anaerolineae bacterium]